MGTTPSNPARELTVTDDTSQTSTQVMVRQAVAQYERPLVLYAFRILSNLDLAREVVQDTFLKLCDQSPDQVADHLAQWLYAVTRNRALDVLRKEKPMKPLQDPDRHVASTRDASPGQAMEQAEASEQLAMAMQQLSPNQQEVIRLKFQHGLSYKDIAKTTQLSTSNVGYLIHTGLKTLRQTMAVQ